MTYKQFNGHRDTDLADLLYVAHIVRREEQHLNVFEKLGDTNDLEGMTCCARAKASLILPEEKVSNTQTIKCSELPGAVPTL